jgi:hypothetical protein
MLGALSFGQSLSKCISELLPGEWSIPDNCINEASTASLKMSICKVVILELLCFDQIPHTHTHAHTHTHTRTYTCIVEVYRF